VKDPVSADRRPNGCIRADLSEAGLARGGHRGFALVELLTATLIGGIVAAATVALLQGHGAIGRRSQEALALTAAAAWTRSIAARDLETAGGDPMRTGIAALLDATAERVVLQADRDGDGSIDASSAERVTLGWGPSGSSGGRLVRALGGQSMAIADGVPRGGLRFRYFAADGAELVPAAQGSGSLGGAELAAVCRVGIELTLVKQIAGAEERVQITSGAALRSCLTVPGRT
jgi:prepilin-type N-terminal cleavage/methylation domain-containing protein